MRAHVWYTEYHQDLSGGGEPATGLTMKVERHLHTEQSEYQQIDVIDTYFFGKVLLLDGLVMVTERDEFVYHEMLTHVPLHVHPNPERVLVIGGGDGGTVRECLEHPAVREVHLCEIDRRVVEVTEEYMPTVASRVRDERVTLHFADGIAHVAEHPDTYDVVLVDSTDPVGFAEGLVSKAFYQSVYRCLREGGIVVGQAESPSYYADIQQKQLANLAAVFPVTSLYLAYIPTYPSGMWSFGFGSKGLHPVDDFDPSKVDMDRLQPKYYNAEVHKGSFMLPTMAQKVLDSALEAR